MPNIPWEEKMIPLWFLYLGDASCGIKATAIISANKRILDFSAMIGQRVLIHLRQFWNNAYNSNHRFTAVQNIATVNEVKLYFLIGFQTERFSGQKTL